jgi:hypothetical protein
MNPLQAFEKWSDDIETTLKNISHNAGLISEHHRIRYEILMNQLKYYKIPIIVISGLNSIFSVGLSAYIEQNVVSTLTCLLSLTVSVISSIELYLSIQKKSDQELITYKAFYILSVKINTTLSLDRERRTVDGDTFLTQMLGEYESLFSNAIANGLGDQDKLVELNSHKLTN